MSKKFDILKQIEFLDQVRIHIFKGEPSPDDLCPLIIQFECLDSSKQVVFDESSLAVMNQKLTEKAKEKVDEYSAQDPRFLKYLEEFAGRLTNELYRNGLAVIEDVPEGHADPYAAIRKQFSRN